MGIMQHHAIVVTSWRAGLIRDAHAEATRIFPWVSPVSAETKVNSWRSFFVPPDGSKEGWEESDDGDKARETFVAWLNAQRHSDGSNSLHWIEVAWGDLGASVERAHCALDADEE